MPKSPFNLDQQNQDIDSRIVAALERLSVVIRSMLWQEGKVENLSPIQIQILIFAITHPPELCKVSLLAHEFNLTKATISDAIRALIRKGLVEKQADSKDTRSFMIVPTTAGSKKAEQLSHFADTLLLRVTELPASGKTQMLDGLLSILGKLFEDGFIPVQRMCFSCRYFDTSGETAFCRLLQKPLERQDLRLDCPEHELIESQAALR